MNTSEATRTDSGPEASGDDDALLTHEHCVGLLPAIQQHEAAKKEAEGWLELPKKLCKGYLLAHPGEELWDGEIAFGFRMQDKHSEEIDWLRLAETQPELALWALRHGLARTDVKTFEAMDQKAQEMAKIRLGFTMSVYSQAMMPMRGRN